MNDPTPSSPILPQLVDSTMLSCFRGCPQKFLLEFCYGFRPPGISVDLHAGGCFSGTLEAFYKHVWVDGLDVPTALARAHHTFISLWSDFTPIKETPKTFDRMWAAVEDYVRVYPPKTDHIQPYFVGDKPTFEFSFAIPLDFSNFPRHPNGDPFVYGGRADLLGQYNGAPIIRDEKTSGRLEQNWAEKWDLRSQFIGYTWAARMSGIDVKQVCVRGIIITKKEIRQVEAIKVYSDDLVERWFEQLRRDLWRMRQCWDESTLLTPELPFDRRGFDFNFGETCTAYGSCIFMPVCQSPQPENWHSTFQVKRWNPLDRIPTEPSSSPESSNPKEDPLSPGTITPEAPSSASTS